MQLIEIYIYIERERHCSLHCVCVCDLMQIKRAAARGLGGYKAKSFKFEPQTQLQTDLQSEL